MSEALLEVLTDRYIVYGENMFAKHQLFYDKLPHYWLEFDVLDTWEGTYIDGNGNEQVGTWLSTDRRKEMFSHLPIVPVHVLYEGEIESADEIGLPLSLLWDGCKECGINNDIDEDELN